MRFRNLPRDDKANLKAFVSDSSGNKFKFQKIAIKFAVVRHIKMSSNISKWFPKVSLQQTNDKVFDKTRNIEREMRMLANKFTTNINFNLLDYYVSNTFRPSIYIICCSFFLSSSNFHLSSPFIIIITILYFLLFLHFN